MLPKNHTKKRRFVSLHKSPPYPLLKILFEFFFQSFQYFLFKPRYIGLRNSENIRDLFLRVLFAAAKTETKFHYFTFSGSKSVHGIFQHGNFNFGLKASAYAVRIRSQHIAQQQFVTFPIDIKRFFNGNFAVRSAVFSKIHQYLIFDTP